MCNGCHPERSVLVITEEKIKSTFKAILEIITLVKPVIAVVKRLIGIWKAK